MADLLLFLQFGSYFYETGVDLRVFKWRDRCYYCYSLNGVKVRNTHIQVEFIFFRQAAN